MNHLSLKDLPLPPSQKRGWPWDEESKCLLEEGPFGLPWPKFSIVTPNYNYGYFLEETIRSVLLQGYPNVEYIIIDGGSNDTSIEIIKKYAPYLSYWISESDSGQTSAINKGFTHASGDIFCWLNSDDILCPGALGKVAQFLKGHPGCEFLAGDGDIVNVAGDKSEYYIKAGGYTLRELLYFYKNKILPQPSVFFSRKIFLEAGGLDNELSYALDLDLWLRIRQKQELFYLPECLSKLRYHAESKTGKEAEAFRRETKKVLFRYIGKTNVLDRLFVVSGIWFFNALVFCRESLSACGKEDYARASRFFVRAIVSWPFILVTKIGLQIMFRLFFLRFFKKRA